jgi:hypothetical protein
MLLLPDTVVSADGKSSIPSLADWAEVVALFGHAPLRKSDVVDIVKDSLFLEDSSTMEAHDEDTADEFGLSGQLDAAALANDIWSHLERRSTGVGDGYPFTWSPDTFERAVDSWEDTLCFSLPLTFEAGKLFNCVNSRFYAGSKFPELFEQVVFGCARKLFRGQTVRFGWPGQETGTTAERIGKLADGMARRTEDLLEKLSEKDKDLGLDVCSAMSFGMDDYGGLIVMIQCATGENWSTKKEPSLEEWKSYIQWRAQLIRALAVPWRMDFAGLGWRDIMRLEAVALDRLRLVSYGNADSLLHRDAIEPLKTWCRARIAELPSAG